MGFVLLCVGTFVCALSVMLPVRALGLPYWSYHAITISVGVLILVIAVKVTAAVAAKRGPDIVPPVAYASWAYYGVNWNEPLPLWLRLLGNAGVWFILASPFELFHSLFW